MELLLDVLDEYEDDALLDDDVLLDDAEALGALDVLTAAAGMPLVLFVRPGGGTGCSLTSFGGA